MRRCCLAWVGMTERFYDRRQAGRFLADRLSQRPWKQQGQVIALPRGGVPVGHEIARQLNWPLDVWLVRKLGVPSQPELAMGAIAVPDVQIVNQALLQQFPVSEEQLRATVRAERQELARRDRLYRQGRSLPVIKDMPVIIADDGLATGATLQAAILGIQRFAPATITVAVPVAAPSSLRRIRSMVDEAVCLTTPEQMGAISHWYVHFDAVSDEEVMKLLQ